MQLVKEHFDQINSAIKNVDSLVASCKDEEVTSDEEQNNLDTSLFTLLMKYKPEKVPGAPGLDFVEFDVDANYKSGKNLNS